MYPHDSQIHCFTAALSVMAETVAQRSSAGRARYASAVEFKKPAPGEELNESGEATVPRQAASVILLRGGSEALELLLVQRTPDARFMGGFWVFPGGAVDAHEGEGDEAHRLAAVRELDEEASVGGIAPAELVKFSRWITPAAVQIRFDTHFFLAAAPEGATPVVDGSEIVDHLWHTPQGALDAYGREELPLVFPTIKHLEQFARFNSADALIEHAAQQKVEPVEPRILMEGEVARVLLPGEPGYD
ncbi:MAG: NUDIX domain-containing protein [Actinobacteria bacterium]|nr:NUDIX domain-containing protein [Actinomycetota bacterium]